MAIWITGDTHADVHRFGVNSFYEQKDFSTNQDENIVIVAGDFGLVWERDTESVNEVYWLNWLSKKPFTIVFVDGNHENHQRLTTYPEKEWHGGKAHEIRPNVLHLIRGEIYNIEGKTFFAFGGAASHDIRDGILDYNDKDWKSKAKELEERGKYFYRVKGLTWWEEELPSTAEMQNGIKNLEKHNFNVDYVITHCPPASIIALLGRGVYKQDRLTQYLEEIRQKMEYRYWFMGHMHVNEQINAKDILIYEQIARIL